MSGFVSRGFRGRRRAEADSARVPPGQYLTDDFPVLSAGPTPHTPLERWSFELRGAVDETVQEEQILADRAAGTLLIRDAGSAADTSWIHDRDDLPRLIRAGRHIARSKRYIRNYGHEIEPGQLAEYVAQEAERGDGWVKLVGDWIERDAGDLTPLWPREALDADAIVADLSDVRFEVEDDGVRVSLAEQFDGARRVAQAS